MARIFLSHASANNAQALALATWLEQQGWTDYFLDIDDDRGIAPGERWLAALTGAVDRCEAVLFLVSPAWRNSKYCFAEFFEAKKLGKRIFGVIVELMALADLPEQMIAEWQCAISPMPTTRFRSAWRGPIVTEPGPIAPAPRRSKERSTEVSPG